MHEDRRPWRAVLVIAVTSTGLACADADPEPSECPIAIAAAQTVYVECVESLGLELESLEIGVDGDIDVVFAASSDAEAVEEAASTCEPAMQEALVLGLVACETTEIGHPAAADELRTQVERAADDGFSGSVAIVRDGALVWQGGVGLADREHAIANTAMTAFDCGSIMKVVTAAAIFQLEAEGALARDATLDEWFTDVPPDKAAITLDQLLVHSAGFQEFHDTEGDFEPMDRATALQRIFAQELLFPPGEDVAYSNSGYTLLAAVVEDASGVPFAEYIRTRLFEVAMMAKTGLYGQGLWSESEAAIGYDDGTFGCNSPACWPAPSWALIGNGGLVSSVDDLARWNAAIDDGTFFAASTRDTYRRDVLGTAGLTIAGEPAYLYSGRNDFGFGAAIAEVPSRGTSIIVAANAAASYNDSALTIQLLQMALGALVELE